MQERLLVYIVISSISIVDRRIFEVESAKNARFYNMHIFPPPSPPLLLFFYLEYFVRIWFLFWNIVICCDLLQLDMVKGLFFAMRLFGRAYTSLKPLENTVNIV